MDHGTGYRTRNILTLPMRNTKGEVVGVLQALNRRDGAFTDEDEELLGALAGPAASAIENAVLNAEIEQLFEGFVQASVVAIEQRDPDDRGPLRARRHPDLRPRPRRREGAAARTGAGSPSTPPRSSRCATPRSCTTSGRSGSASTSS